MWKRIAQLMAASLLALSPCIAQDAANDPDGGGGENASNPQAKVKNTGVRIQYFDNPDGPERWDYWLRRNYQPSDPAAVSPQTLAPGQRHHHRSSRPSPTSLRHEGLLLH